MHHRRSRIMTSLLLSIVSHLSRLQADIVTAIMFVDGTGTTHRVPRSSRVGRGLAGGLGLLGVITEVSLQLRPGLGRMRSWSTGPRSDANMAQELLQLWVSAAGLECSSCAHCWAEALAIPPAVLLHAGGMALLLPLMMQFLEFHLTHVHRQHSTSTTQACH
jgi:FAD/FMN-containing dehydrogenase